MPYQLKIKNPTKTVTLSEAMRITSYWPLYGILNHPIKRIEKLADDNTFYIHYKYRRGHKAGGGMLIRAELTG